MCPCEDCQPATELIAIEAVAYRRAVAGFGPLPTVIAHGGLVGPRLTTLIAYLKGACHASYSTIRKFLRDVLQVTISRQGGKPLHSVLREGSLCHGS